MTKILVVDDSVLMVSVIRNFVQKDFPQVEIVEAFTGTEAVKKYAEELPDLVFLDIVMPEMDGLTALEQIKQQHLSPKVVMCTSLKEPGQEERARAAGAVGYIMKPFRKQDIVDQIKEHLHL